MNDIYSMTSSNNSNNNHSSPVSNNNTHRSDSDKDSDDPALQFMCPPTTTTTTTTTSLETSAPPPPPELLQQIRGEEPMEWTTVPYGSVEEMYPFVANANANANNTASATHNDNEDDNEEDDEQSNSSFSSSEGSAENISSSSSSSDNSDLMSFWDDEEVGKPEVPIAPGEQDHQWQWLSDDEYEYEYGYGNISKDQDQEPLLAMSHDIPSVNSNNDNYNRKNRQQQRQQQQQQQQRQQQHHQQSDERRHNVHQEQEQPAFIPQLNSSPVMTRPMVKQDKIQRLYQEQVEFLNAVKASYLENTKTADKRTERMLRIPKEQQPKAPDTTTGQLLPSLERKEEDPVEKTLRMYEKQRRALRRPNNHTTSSSKKKSAKALHKEQSALIQQWKVPPAHETADDRTLRWYAEQAHLFTSQKKKKNGKHANTSLSTTKRKTTTTPRTRRYIAAPWRRCSENVLIFIVGVMVLILIAALIIYFTRRKMAENPPPPPPLGTGGSANTNQSFDIMIEVSTGDGCVTVDPSNNLLIAPCDYNQTDPTQKFRVFAGEDRIESHTGRGCIEGRIEGQGQNVGIQYCDTSKTEQRWMQSRSSRKIQLISLPTFCLAYEDNNLVMDECRYQYAEQDFDIHYLPWKIDAEEEQDSNDDDIINEFTTIPYGTSYITTVNSAQDCISMDAANNLYVDKCRGNVKGQLFRYNTVTHQIRSSTEIGCVTHNTGAIQNIYIASCLTSSRNQEWYPGKDGKITNNAGECWDIRHGFLYLLDCDEDWRDTNRQKFSITPGHFWRDLSPTPAPTLAPSPAPTDMVTPRPTGVQPTVTTIPGSGQIRDNTNNDCVTVDGSSLYLRTCSSNDPSQLFFYDDLSNRIVHATGDGVGCIDSRGYTMEIQDCQDDSSQRWYPNEAGSSLHLLGEDSDYLCWQSVSGYLRRFSCNTAGTSKVSFSFPEGFFGDEEDAAGSSVGSAEPVPGLIQISAGMGCITIDRFHPENALLVAACGQYTDYQIFHYDPKTEHIINPTTGLCIQRSSSTSEIQMDECINTYNSPPQMYYPDRGGIIRSRESSYCLQFDSSNGSLLSWSCGASDYQNFLVPIGFWGDNTFAPTNAPTTYPTNSPTTRMPTQSPSSYPTPYPTQLPSSQPSTSPTSPTVFVPGAGRIQDARGTRCMSTSSSAYDSNLAFESCSAAPSFSYDPDSQTIQAVGSSNCLTIHAQYTTTFVSPCSDSNSLQKWYLDEEGRLRNVGSDWCLERSIIRTRLRQRPRPSRQTQQTVQKAMCDTSTSQIFTFPALFWTGGEVTNAPSENSTAMTTALNSPNMTVIDELVSPNIFNSGSPSAFGTNVESNISSSTTNESNATVPSF